jgi:general secretion pathway protein K
MGGDPVMRGQSLSRKRKSRGVALVTVLLMVSIATVLVVSMTSKQYFSVRRQGNIFINTQAWQYVLSLEQWATVVLNSDARENQTDSFSDDWHIGIPETTVQQAQIAARITDLQGRLNLNNLIKGNKLSKDDFAVFKRLMNELEIDNGILNAIVDWIDADSEPRYPGGAEDNYYASQTPGQRTANQPIVHTEELLKIKGITTDIYLKLQPYISALPGYQSVNINTASDKVLMALTEGMTQSDVDKLIAYREENVVDDIGEWHKLPEFSGRKVNETLVATKSSFFGLDNYVQTEKRTMTVFTALYREKTATRVLYRQKRGY